MLFLILIPLNVAYIIGFFLVKKRIDKEMEQVSKFKKDFIQHTVGKKKNIFS